MKISQICIAMDDLGASDLFLSVGRIPAMRRGGSVVPVPETNILTEEDVRVFFNDYLPSGTWERLQNECDIDVGTNIASAGRFRLNLSFQRGRASMAIRRVPSGRLSFDELRLPEAIRTLAEKPRGLILVTGATGSGKSTTLAAMLNHINQHLQRHIVTIEDPIEFVHEDEKSVISQREIGSDTKDFASALRHVVRQNPDVIFIGELRDLETISTAISAALTGHLVAATMHTIDASQTIERILNYFPDGTREQVAVDFAAALQGIISQRLLSCPDGTKRVPAFEVLVNTPLVQRLICNRSFEELAGVLKQSNTEGMIDFNHSILELYRNGLVSLETAAHSASNKDEFMLLAEGLETGVDTLRSYSSDPEQGFSIKKLLRDAAHYGASDLLLTAGSPPVVRLDGILQAFAMPVMSGTDTQKLLYSVLSAKQRADFEEQREIDFALSVKGMINENDNTEFRFRVNGFFQKGKVACAFRLIPMAIPNPDSLGLPKVVLELAKKPQGLVLVTGPTGHGKSTTLAALLDQINRTRPCHIITIEDPIEFVHPHRSALVEQREVNADTHSFSDALKYVLRQDPDVILIGEMRDAETISAALTAAETGHLVFATLHTNDVAQSIDRIIDVFPADRQNQVRSQLAASIEAVISQRLLPRANGKGRVAAFEVLIGTIAVRALIRDKRTHQLYSTIESSAKDGMITMDKALKKLLETQQISYATYVNYARTPEDLSTIMQGQMPPPPPPKRFQF